MISALQLSSRSTLFWQWWSAELIELWAIMLNAIAPRWRSEIAVSVSPQSLSFASGDQALLVVSRIQLDAQWAEEERVKIEALLQSGRRIRLVYPAAEAFRYRRTLPLAASSYLRNAISLQLPKWMPLKVEALLTDYRVVGRDAATGTVEVQVAALKRAEVEGLVAQMRSVGFRIKRIGLLDVNGGETAFSFSLRQAARFRSRLSRAERWLFASAAALGCATVLTGATEGFRSHRSLALAAETTHATASEAAQRRQEVIERIEPLKALSRLETSASSSDLMVEISQLVPDGSWLTTFERRDRQVRIVGLSPDAAGMVKRLASSALLSDVSLRSSISAGIGTGLDRFEINAEFKSASP